MSCIINFVFLCVHDSKECLIIIWGRNGKKHFPQYSYIHTPRVGTSRYVPPSGIYNTHAPLCVVCMLFLDGYDANMPINTKRCCVFFNELWHMTQTRSQVRIFPKVTYNAVHDVHTLKYSDTGKSFLLPQWLTLLWKKPHCCMVEPFNRTLKILLGDLQRCFQGDGEEKT